MSSMHQEIVRILPKLMKAFTWSKMFPRMKARPMAFAMTTATGQESFTPKSESNRFVTAFAPPMELEVSTFICERQMMASPTPPAASTSEMPGLVIAACAAPVAS